MATVWPGPTNYTEQPQPAPGTCHWSDRYFCHRGADRTDEQRRAGHREGGCDDERLTGIVKVFGNACGAVDVS